MQGKRRPAAFVDRDGVINAELAYVHRAEDFHILPGVFEGLRLLKDLGFVLVVVTNQAGIAKGLYAEADYLALSQHMRSLLQREHIVLDGVYHCPHHPDGAIPAYTMDCDCRKPAPGMVLQAASDLHLDLSRSVMIGDKPSDSAAGRAAGVKWAVLVESGHRLPDDTGALADHRCKNLLQAAEWVRAKLETPPLEVSS